MAQQNTYPSTQPNGQLGTGSSQKFTTTGNSTLGDPNRSQAVIFQKHLDKLVDKNKDYFCNLRNNFSFNKTGNKNLATDYRRGQESIYQKDFPQHPTEFKKTQNAADVYGPGYYDSLPMELKTINRSDYITHQPANTKTCQDKEDKTAFIPFAGTTDYQNQYLNWGINPQASLKPPNHPTVMKELKFQGLTAYNEYHNDKKIVYDPQVEYIKKNAKTGQFKSPINPDFPFLGETSNMFTYQPFKTKKFSKQKQAKAPTALPAFEGQFKTMNQAEYGIKKPLDLHRW